ncbi:hypothetical protein RhiirA1_422375, partial [Rhizophagus irregularis]
IATNEHFIFFFCILWSIWTCRKFDNFSALWTQDLKPMMPNCLCKKGKEGQLE